MIDLKKLGYEKEKYGKTEQGIPARVTAVHRERYEVISAQGESFARCRASAYRNCRAADYPTVGDFVELKNSTLGQKLRMISHLFRHRGLTHTLLFPVLLTLLMTGLKAQGMAVVPELLPPEPLPPPELLPVYSQCAYSVVALSKVMESKSTLSPPISAVNQPLNV